MMPDFDGNSIIPSAKESVQLRTVSRDQPPTLVGPLDDSILLVLVVCQAYLKQCKARQGIVITSLRQAVTCVDTLSLCCVDRGLEHFAKEKFIR